MKKLILMLLVLSGGILNVSATYYLTGINGNWDPENPIAMTDNGDGTYSHSYDLTSTSNQYFAFSTVKGSWDDFNSARISPNTANQEITSFGEFVSLNTGGNSSYSYYFTKKYYKATYTITLKPSENKVKIDISFGNCKVYVQGEIDSQSWGSNIGTEMTASDGVYTKQVTLGAGEAFSFTTKLSESADKWSEISAFQFKGWDEFNVEGDVVVSTSSTSLPAATYNLKVDLNNEKIYATMVSGYKYITSSDGSAWTSGGSLVESAGVYSATIPSMAGKYFVIIPDVTDLAGTTLPDWKYAVRPEAGSSEFTVYFQKYNSTTVNNTSAGDAALWKLDTNNDAATTISYTPQTGAYTIDCARSLSIGTAGCATWSNGEKYTVTGATANAVKDMDTYAKLTSIPGGTVFPAGTALLLQGSGDVTINAVYSDAETDTYTTTYASENDLLGSGNSTKAIDAGCYVLYWDGTNPASVGFKKTDNGTLGAHKAYLPASSPAREFLGFEENVTGIKSLNTTLSESDGIAFDLQGRKVAQPTRGLYIVNGKKVLVK